MTTTPLVPPAPVGPVQFGSTRRGLRVVWLPADGPTVARLAFRVGTVDERLPERGTSHLVEHLAHRDLEIFSSSFDRPANAHTTPLTTAFHVRGSAAEVGEHLQAVVAGLAAVGGTSTEDLAREVGVLRLEAARRGSGLWDDLRTARHGLRGWGSVASVELGLGGVDADALDRWVRRWFTAANAVLWVAGPEAPAWPLALGPGTAVLPPPPTSLPEHLPAWTRGRAGLVAFTAVVDRASVQVPAATAAWWWLQRRLAERLRGRDGTVYDVDASTGRLSGEQLELAMAAVTSPDRQEEVFRAVQEVVGLVCREPLPEAALATWVRDTTEDWRPRDHAPVTTRHGQGDGPLEHLDAVSRTWLLSGAEAPPDADLHRELREEALSLTPEAVRRALVAALDTALLQVPEGVPAPREMTALTTAPARPLLSGRTFVPARELAGGDRLVVSPEGVMLEPEDAAASTWRWDRAVAVLRRPDGARVLVEETGAVALVDPRLWAEGALAVAAVDASAPADLLVDVAGDSEDALAEVFTHRLSGLASVSTGPLVALAVAASLCLAGAVALAAGSGEPVPSAVTAAVLAAAVGVLVRALVVRLRVPKARRTSVDGRARTRTAVAFDQALARGGTARSAVIAVAGWSLAVVVGLALLLHGTSPLPALLPAAFALRATMELVRRRRRAHPQR